MKRTGVATNWNRTLNKTLTYLLAQSHAQSDSVCTPRREMVGSAVGEVGRPAGWDGLRPSQTLSRIILIPRKMCSPQTPDRPNGQLLVIAMMVMVVVVMMMSDDGER